MSSQLGVENIKTWLGSGSVNIFAMPFGGKDTNAKQLAVLLGGAVIGGGDIIRNTPQLASLSAKVEDGKLAPIDEYLKAVVPYFSQPEFQGKPLVLSSVGRWHGEESPIMAAAHQSGHPIKAVVYIVITEEELWRRWHAAQQLNDRGQRADDSKEHINRRLVEFRTKTIPVLDFYRDKGLLVEVDGIGSREEILRSVLDGLSTLMTS